MVARGSARHPGSIQHRGVSACRLAFLDLFVSHSDECGRRGIGLPTAASAAGAGNTAEFNYHMTELALGVVRAREDLSVNDDAASDTRAERYGSARAAALCRACASLAPSGSVSVVLSVYGNVLCSKLVSKYFGYGEVEEAKITCALDYSRRRIYDSG